MNVTIEKIISQSDFLNLKDDWTELHVESYQSDNIFLTHEWFSSWWSAFGENSQLYILLLKRHNEIIAIAPLMKKSRIHMGIPIKVISLIANYHSNRSDFIIKKNNNEVMATIFEYLLQSRSDWHLIELDFLPSDSLIVKTLNRLSIQGDFQYLTKSSYHSPYVFLNGSWNDFYDKLKGRFRRNLRNREKRLACLGKVSFEHYDARNGSLATCLNEVFEVGSKSWKEKEGTAIASTSEYKSFYENLSQIASSRGWLDITLLKLNNKTMAFHYSLRFKEWLLLLKTEFDLKYKQYSPGQVLQKEVLKRCFAEKLKGFEFLGDTMVWKRDWTNLERVHKLVLIFNDSPRSKLLNFLEKSAKPLLKKSKLLNKIFEKP